MALPFAIAYATISMYLLESVNLAKHATLRARLSYQLNRALRLLLS